MGGGHQLAPGHVANGAPVTLRLMTRPGPMSRPSLMDADGQEMVEKT